MIFGNTISTLFSIIVGVITYGIAVLFLKVLSEEDQKIIDQCIKDYDLQCQSILSGMYSDKITTTH